MNNLTKLVLLFFILLSEVVAFGQDKRGNKVVFGGGAMIASFDDTIRPFTSQLYANPSSYVFWNGASNICDSNTGNLLMISNGYLLYDTTGNVIENGDSLVPQKIYLHNSIPTSSITQGSIILPKGSSGLYYVFTPTMTDSAYDLCIGGTTGKCPFDLLQYHIVDMNANGGLGKVIQKNIPLLTNVEMSKVGMMACKHANGYDWWLLKQALDTNLIYTFLVTKDTVLLDTMQGFSEPNFEDYDLTGQSCFSNDGSKYAFVTSIDKKLFIADFDRCYGLLSNSKAIKVPLDSTTHPFYQSQGILDSLLNGVCFSPNDSFLYITRRYNIYQYELNNSDSATAWVRIKHGEDTTLVQFAYYGQLQMGIDGRIYIGKVGGTGTQNSVIDYPNIKGVGCGFCRKCLRYDISTTASTSLANMPNFNMPVKDPCFPIGVQEYANVLNQLEVFPNPTATVFYIKNRKGKKKELFNAIGELIISTYRDEIEVRGFAKGFYFIKCEGLSKKVFIE